MVLNFGYIDLIELDFDIHPKGNLGQLGSGPYIISNEPQRKSNPIGFVWPEEPKRIISGKV